MKMFRCEICNKNFKVITWKHLKKHNLSPKEYKQKFPNAKIGREDKNHPMYGKENKHTIETKQKISNKLKGRKLSLKTCRKMSEARQGENNPFYGKHHRKESMDKMVATRRKNDSYKQTQATKDKISKGNKEYYKLHPERNKGKNHPNWQGGISNNPYSAEFSNKLREEIRKRDNYQCQLCGITEEEHLIIYGRILSIHHMDYNKKNCKENNLISLCNQCNARVNFNRIYWINYFRGVLNEIVHSQ